MALADTPTSVALVQTGPELPAGIDTGIRPHHKCPLLTPGSSSASTRASSWTGRPPAMFSFTDYDGNRFYVSQV
jgi:hypothetical protein